MGELFLKLLMGHAFADFALQSEFIARNKNRNSGVPAGYNAALHGPVQTIWPYVLTAHALVHGGCALIATGSPLIGLLETISHWAIDFGKCERWYGIHTDQWLHIGCKVIWVALLTVGV